MNNKKQELKKLISQFTKEELIEILSEPNEENEESTVHKIDSKEASTKKRSRRGRGTRKRNKSNSSAAKRGGDKGSACRVKSLDTSGERPNKFLDFMEGTILSASERTELEEASKSDKQNNSQRTPRTRTSSLVDVECRVCGQQQQVSASIVYDAGRWKCNQCSTQACDG